MDECNPRPTLPFSEQLNLQQLKIFMQKRGFTLFAPLQRTASTVQLPNPLRAVTLV